MLDSGSFFCYNLIVPIVSTVSVTQKNFNPQRKDENIMHYGRLPYKYLIPILLSIAALTLFSCSAHESKNEPTSSDPERTRVSAYILKIDDIEVAYLESEEDAESVIARITDEKTEALIELGAYPVSVAVNNAVAVTPALCYEDETIDPQTAIERFYAYGGSFSYTVVLRESSTEPIPFETVYKNSSSYYEGEKMTSVVGKNGEKRLTYEVTYKDGEESSRFLLSEEETLRATDCVILVGTKKSTVSKGTYAFPLKNMYVTSSYGGRYLSSSYDFHLGVDLRAANGTSVYASDGGEVIYSGYMGSYGYLIKIRHDNGDVTYYAHLSSLGVKKGVRVYQGQYIARSGATGNVTGAHLHFEIRRNGKTVDPLTLLPKF